MGPLNNSSLLKRPDFSGVALRFVAISIASCLVLSLAGCGSATGSSEQPETTVSTTAHSSAQPQESTSDSLPIERNNGPKPTLPEGAATPAAEIYRQVIADPTNFPVNDAARYSPKGTYSYAVVEATSDSSPELLLRVNSAEFSPVLLFTQGSSPDEVIQSTEVLMEGAAGAGGSRARLAASQSGAGVYQVDYHSLRHEAQSTLYAMQGTVLAKASGPTEFPLAQPLPDHREITWFDSTDLTGLTAPQAGTALSVPAPAPSAPAQETGDGMHRFTGVVTEKSTSEVMNGEPSPNGEPDTNRYLVLSLDAPVEVTAKTAGSDKRTETISEISLGEHTSSGADNEWSNYIGTRVSVTAGPEQVRFPTDTSLPLGMLRLVSYNNLETG